MGSGRELLLDQVASHREAVLARIFTPSISARWRAAGFSTCSASARPGSLRQSPVVRGSTDLECCDPAGVIELFIAVRLNEGETTTPQSLGSVPIPP